MEEIVILIFIIVHHFPHPHFCRLEEKIGKRRGLMSIHIVHTRTFYVVRCRIYPLLLFSILRYLTLGPFGPFAMGPLLQGSFLCLGTLVTIGAFVMGS